MKKTDKNRDNAICACLTDVCDAALDTVMGFAWITHTVNYARFPDSLRVICVFESDEDLKNAYNTDEVASLRTKITSALLDIDVVLPKPDKQICFDTEEACVREHDGRWKTRLSK